MLIKNSALIDRFSQRDFKDYYRRDKVRHSLIAVVDDYLRTNMIDYQIFFNELIAYHDRLSKINTNDEKMELLNKLILFGFSPEMSEIHLFAAEEGEDENWALEHPYGFIYCKGINALINLEDAENTNDSIQHLIPRLIP